MVEMTDRQLDIILDPIPIWMQQLVYLDTPAKETSASWFGPIDNWLDHMLGYFDDDPWPEVLPWE